jgi:hypothetical protein
VSLILFPISRDEIERFLASVLSFSYSVSPINYFLSADRFHLFGEAVGDHREHGLHAGVGKGEATRTLPRMDAPEKQKKKVVEGGADGKKPAAAAGSKQQPAAAKKKPATAYKKKKPQLPPTSWERTLLRNITGLPWMSEPNHVPTRSPFLFYF